jgi:hypothetical protein
MNLGLVFMKIGSGKWKDICDGTEKWEILNKATKNY